MPSFITESLQWINALFPGHAPLTEHQLVLLMQGELRACTDIDALPPNAFPREHYILKSHPLSMACFVSKEAHGDEHFFSTLVVNAEKGGDAKVKLEKRTNFVKGLFERLYKWMTRLPRVQSEATRLRLKPRLLAELIHRDKFPQHLSVSQLAKLIDSDAGLAVCEALIFNPSAEVNHKSFDGRLAILAMDPSVRLERAREFLAHQEAKAAAKAAKPAPAVVLPPAVEEGELAPAPVLPPAVEEGILPRSVGNGPTPYSDAELKEFPDAYTLIANVRGKMMSKLPASAEGLKELMIPPPDFEMESGDEWYRLLTTYFIKHMDKLVPC